MSGTSDGRVGTLGVGMGICVGIGVDGVVGVRDVGVLVLDEAFGFGIGVVVGVVMGVVFALFSGVGIIVGIPAGLSLPDPAGKVSGPSGSNNPIFTHQSRPIPFSSLKKYPPLLFNNSLASTLFVPANFFCRLKRKFSKLSLVCSSFSAADWCNRQAGISPGVLVSSESFRRDRLRLVMVVGVVGETAVGVEAGEAAAADAIGMI